jgi:hypothetical protein
MWFKEESEHDEKAGPGGIPFQRSTWPKTLLDITGGKELMSVLQRDRHKARRPDGQESAGLLRIEPPKKRTFFGTDLNRPRKVLRGAARNEQNIAERGLSFVLVPLLFEGGVVERTDTRCEYSETRVQAYDWMREPQPKGTFRPLRKDKEKFIAVA